MFGLLGFWNSKKRNEIRRMIKSKLPKGYFIERISWCTAEKIEKGVYEVYSKIAIYDREKRLFSSNYWSYRDNGRGVFDLLKNKFRTGWSKE
jgi:hypothetical protein